MIELDFNPEENVSPQERNQSDTYYRIKNVFQHFKKEIFPYPINKQAKLYMYGFNLWSAGYL